MKKGNFPQAQLVSQYPMEFLASSFVLPTATSNHQVCVDKAVSNQMQSNIERNFPSLQTLGDTHRDKQIWDRFQLHWAEKSALATLDLHTYGFVP